MATDTPTVESGPYTPMPGSDFAKTAGDIYGPEIEAARGKVTEASGTEQRILKERGAAVAPAIGQLEQGLAAPRPTAPQRAMLPPPPSRQLHEFLAPVENQPPQQTVMQMISALTMLGTGIGGLAKGDARAALSSLTGALTGWKEGQRERADRAFADWKANTDALLKNSQLEWDEYYAAMEDRTASNAERLQNVQAIAMKFDNPLMAAAAAKGDANTLIGQLMKDRDHIDNVGLKYATLENSHEMRLAQIASQEQIARERSQNQLDIARMHDQADAARLAERIRHDKEMEELRAEGLYAIKPRDALKLEQQDLGITQKLTQRERLKEAVEYLDKVGVIPKGPTKVDRLKAWTALQTKFGDPEVGKNIEALKRWGTSLLLASEISTAGAASVFRIKSIAEAEAGNVQYVPKTFWDEFLVDSEVILKGQQENIRSTLGRKPAATTPGKADFTYNPATGQLEPTK